MKYTMSTDGIERMTIRVPVRLTREEMKDIRAACQQDGESLHSFLASRLYEGLESYGQYMTESDYEDDELRSL